MKRLLSLLLTSILLLTLTACSQTDSLLKLAVKQVDKPILDAYKTMGFEEPEDHADGFALVVEDGIELCGESGAVVLTHMDSDNTAVLDNPQLNNIQFSFVFEQPKDEDDSFADMDSAAVAEKAKQDGTVAMNIWDVGKDIQVVLSGMSVGNDSESSDGAMWTVSISIHKKTGANY